MATAADTESFEQLLEHLRQTRGFDFTAYKRTSLIRRVLRRMQTIGVATFDAYLDYLQLHPDEFAPLFNTILINVTSYFRDPDVWSHIDTVVLPQLLDNRPPSRPLRIWSAGCASGEEAYSLAMLLAERFGIDGVRERTKIYATDVDDEALTEARRATYSAGDIAELPPGFAEKYFRTDGDGATLNRELRRAVMFGRLDLLQDAPISRIDLLLCRNTLMYFNADAQARILNRLAFSLDPRGFLALGRAELLFSHTTLFAPVDLPRRIFRVLARPSHQDRGAAPTTGRDNMAHDVSAHARLRQAAFEADPTSQLVVDSGGMVVSATAGACHVLGIRSSDVGRLLRELEISYRPVDLRSAIDRVTADRREVVVKDVHHSVAGEPRYFDVTIAPIVTEQQVLAGVRVVFDDSTDVHRLQAELNASKQELDTAYEELQSTNEELETTNEELQSTVEELETTNEELQSTNEELETMNEELQSTNEELQTINDDLRTRGLDADVVNAYLTSVFSSLRSAVVVLDRDYRVRVWNRLAEDLWGIRTDEAVGAPFFSLDIGLPVGELAQPIRTVMNGEKTSVEKAIRSMTRRGKTISCLVSVTPLNEAVGSVVGVILFMDESDLD